MNETQISLPGATAFRRDDVTIAAYLLLTALTLCTGMLGPIIPWLRDALGISYRQAAYHTVAMSLGVTLTALFMPTIVPRLGQKGCATVALAGFALGLTGLCLAPSFAVSVLACGVSGAAVACAVAVAPAVMAEANALAYFGFLFAPAIVGLASAHANWRASFVAPLIAYAGLWFFLRRLDFGGFGQKAQADAPTQALPAAFWAHLTMLSLSICAEIGLLIWGPSFLEAALGLARENALWAAMAFPAGMGIGRLAVAALLRQMAARRLTLPLMLLGALGATAVANVTSVPAAVAGLFVAGLGIAGLYPFGITQALRAAQPATARASARAPLAPGLATLLGPLLIGAIADRYGMRAALGIVPAFLALAAAAHLIGRRLETKLNA